MKTSNKTIAAQLRTLALEHEQSPAKGFTCNAVRGACGEPVEQAYREACGFGYEYSRGMNEDDLWDCPDIDDIRVLLLCMAAAMAETGDL